MEEEKIEQPQAPEEAVNIVPRGKPFFVFNFNTLLALILLAGLAVLYFLHFRGSKSASIAPSVQVQKAAGKSLSVAFVNLDSLNASYEYVKVLRRDLEGTGKRLQTEILKEQDALEKEGAELQRQMQTGSITEDKARQTYEKIMEKGQALEVKKQRYTQQVADQELEMNIRLVDSVTGFLKRFNKEYRFDYIMGFKTGGEILVANDTLDITRPVLDALNGEYRKRK